MFAINSYFSATRHPWACIFFVLPLLVAYEAGVLVVGLDQPELLRNGADVWLRRVLHSLGMCHLLWAPALILMVLLLWTLARREQGPRDYISVLIGMTAESLLFALTLWVGCHMLAPVLQQLGVQLSAQSTPDPAVQKFVCFLGAGIYEETLFRLLLFSVLRWLLEWSDTPWPGATALAAIVSALLFSAAHNIGPYGEQFHPFIFTFRAAAGLYFVILYQLRGFGIAVGAHAGYDVLVGLLTEQ